MSFKTKTKARQKSTKQATTVDDKLLLRTQRDVRALRDQLSQEKLKADKARYEDSNNKAEQDCRRKLEFMQENRQEMAYVVTKNATLVTNLNEKIENLEKSVRELNSTIEEKESQLDQLKQELSETLMDRDENIKRMTMELNNQSAAYTTSFDYMLENLNEKLLTDIDQICNNHQQWAIRILDTFSMDHKLPTNAD